MKEYLVCYQLVRPGYTSDCRLYSRVFIAESKRKLYENFKEANNSPENYSGTERIVIAITDLDD